MYSINYRDLSPSSRGIDISLFDAAALSRFFDLCREIGSEILIESYGTVPLDRPLIVPGNVVLYLHLASDTCHIRNLENFPGPECIASYRYFRGERIIIVADPLLARDVALFAEMICSLNPARVELVVDIGKGEVAAKLRRILEEHGILVSVEFKRFPWRIR